MLDQTSARTAPAEGHQTQPPSPAARRPEARDAHERGADAGDPAVAAAAGQQLCVVPPAPTAGPAPAPQGDAPAAAAVDAAPVPATPPAAPAVALAFGPPEPALTTQQPGTPMPTAPVLSAGGPATAIAPVGDGPAPSPATTTTPAPAVAADPAALAPAPEPTSDPAATPAPALAPDAAPTPGDHGAQPDPQGRPATEPPAQTAPAPAGAPTPAAPVPGVNATQAAAAPAPAATPAPVAPNVPRLTAASLYATIDRVQDLVRIAATRGGGARATLQLKPVELGLVDVQLRTTRDGLVATINAQDSAGVSALQQAGAELRRSLEDRGVTLARLDVQLAPGQDGRQAGSDEGRRFGGTRGSAGASGLPGDQLDGDDEELLVATVTRAPAHGLVDIQA